MSIDRNLALEATRLALTREQRLSALGGLAAAAAHELGSPLATITIVAKELEKALPPDASWQDDVKILLRVMSRRKVIKLFEIKISDMKKRSDGDYEAEIPQHVSTVAAVIWLFVGLGTLLVGADGIWSDVRRLMRPEFDLTFSGMMAR